MPDRMSPLARSAWPLLRMRDGGQVEADAGDGAVLLERALGKVGAVVGDDVVRHVLAHRYILDEPDGCWPVQFLDRSCLDPLGEFVHYHQQVRHATSSGFEGAHHVESPDHEGPGDRWFGVLTPAGGCVC